MFNSVKQIFRKLKKSKSVKDSLGFLSASLISQIVVFLSGVFVIRALGPELRGYWSFLAILGFFLVPIFSFGFLAGLGYYISSKRYQPLEITQSVAWVATARGSVIILLVIGLHYLGWLGETGNQLTIWELLPVLITFPLNLTKESYHRILLSDSKYRQANVLTVIFSLCSPIIIFILVVVMKLAFLGVLIGIVLSNVANFGFTLYLFKKAYGSLGIKAPYHKGFVRDAFRYGIKGWVGDIAVTTNNRGDQLILSYFLSPVSLGLYSICGSLGQMLWLLPGSIRQILYNKNAALNSDLDRKRLTAKYHAFFMILGVIMTVIAIVFAPFIVHFLFGEEFSGAIAPLRIYLIGTGIYTGTMVLTKYFIGSDKIIYTSYIQLFSAVVGIITALLFVSKFGLIGAAISSSLSYSISYFLSVYYFKDIRALIGGFSSFLSILKPTEPVKVETISSGIDNDSGSYSSQ